MKVTEAWSIKAGWHTAETSIPDEWQGSLSYELGKVGFYRFIIFGDSDAASLELYKGNDGTWCAVVNTNPDDMWQEVIIPDIGSAFEFARLYAPVFAPQAGLDYLIERLHWVLDLLERVDGPLGDSIYNRNVERGMERRRRAEQQAKRENPERSE